jgi:hypothetical protein
VPTVHTAFEHEPPDAQLVQVPALHTRFVPQFVPLVFM